MTRKVRLTDYNQRIEVPQGAALFLEGGDIVVDGEIGSEGDSLGIVGGKPGYAPGGGGGGFSPTITDPQDGDVLARVGGVWVNSGNLKVGLSYGFFAGLDLSDGGSHRIPFIDDGGNNGQIYWNAGLTINDTNDGLIVTVDGRYRVTIMATAARDATAWWVIGLDAFVNNTADNFGGQMVDVAPASILPFPGPGRSYEGSFECSIGDILTFSVNAIGGSAVPGSGLNAAGIIVQYVGPRNGTNP